MLTGRYRIYLLNKLVSRRNKRIKNQRIFKAKIILEAKRILNLPCLAIKIRRMTAQDIMMNRVAVSMIRVKEMDSMDNTSGISQEIVLPEELFHLITTMKRLIKVIRLFQRLLLPKLARFKKRERPIKVD